MQKCPNCGTAIENWQGRFLAKGHVLKCDHCESRLRAKGTNKGWVVLISIVVGIAGIAMASLASSDFTYWLLVVGFCLALFTVVNVMEKRIVHLEVMGK